MTLHQICFFVLYVYCFLWKFTPYIFSVLFVDRLPYVICFCGLSLHGECIALHFGGDVCCIHYYFNVSPINLVRYCNDVCNPKLL